MRSILLAVILMAVSTQSASAQCGANPTSGADIISASNQIVNSYYPGTGNPLAGSTSLSVGTLDGRGSGATFSPGDLVLIIQMQGADLSTSNSDAYGDGVAGGYASGTLAGNLYAGYYEYNTVNIVAGSTLNFTYGLANNYYSQAFTTTTSIRTYQVIRVPRYYDLTVNSSASVICPPWNGATGGVTVLDAINVFTLNGTVNVTGLGFRGGGGKNFTGASTGNTNGTTTLVNTDYRWNSAITLAANTTGGAKGEGIAGTPAYTLINGATVTQTETVEGYLDGAMGRGAPANAGGGSTDGVPVGSPANNQYNTGGGGGANAGNGGVGGSGWHSGTGDVTTYPYGGHGGAAFTQHSLARFIMGGGAGSGTANNSTPANEYQSSGACGGGLIIARAKSYAGSGSLVANGADAPGVVGVGGITNTDAAGGGGGGGTIVVVTRASGAAGLDAVTAAANGGKGGDMTNYYDHGPGGGGGGGIIYTNGMLASTTVAGGANGRTRTGSISGPITNDFGAMAGSNGLVTTLAFVPVLVNNNNLASPCGVLPVTLTGFTAFVKSTGIVLQWQISNAVHLHHFEIEYSTDGINFSYAGNTAYLSGQLAYGFLHHYSSSSLLYYRLKLVDDNSMYNYSKTISTKVAGALASSSLFPNPGTGNATLQFVWSAATAATVKIFDATGRLIKQKGITLRQGDNSIPLTTESLSAGTYIIQVNIGSKLIASEWWQLQKN